MGEIVNLRRVRKRRDRERAADDAAENRVRFGLPVAERRARAAAEALAARRLDGHRRSDDGSADPAAQE